MILIPSSALRAAAMAAILLAAAPAAASEEEGWEALRQPGAVAMMRHAIAPGTGDPAHFALGDCATQRNLDERGRAQARAVGEAFRSRGVAPDRILTSQWCRARETAELLGLGAVEELPTLNSFFRDRSTRDAQTEATRAYLASLEPDETVVLVTHQVNITALTGRIPSSGEIIVFRLGADDAVEVLDEILAPP